MPHLIDHDTGPLAEVQLRLQRAHDAAVITAIDLAHRLVDIPREQWGTTAKRIGVRSGVQPLTELINQTASVERLLDALEWIATQRSDSVTVSVNPTTSSNGPDLITREASPWVFEVSDVARPNNTNKKLDHDLSSLCAAKADCPDGRFFLVVSTEWAGCRRHPYPSGSDAVSRDRPTRSFTLTSANEAPP